MLRYSHMTLSEVLSHDLRVVIMSVYNRVAVSLVTLSSSLDQPVELNVSD